MDKYKKTFGGVEGQYLKLNLSRYHSWKEVRTLGEIHV